MLKIKKIFGLAIGFRRSLMRVVEGLSQCNLRHPAIQLLPCDLHSRPRSFKISSLSRSSASASTSAMLLPGAGPACRSALLLLLLLATTAMASSATDAIRCIMYLTG